MAEKKTLHEEDAPVCEAFRVAEQERARINRFRQHATPYNYGEAASKDPSDTQPLPPPIATSVETAQPVRLTAEQRLENAQKNLLNRGQE